MTNRLISQLVPDDYVSRFVFDKQGFYKTYEQYDEKFRHHVVATLNSTYLQDRKAWRKTLYGIGDDDNA